MSIPFRRVRPRVSIVTGGASGIGRALAGRLVDRGGHVVIADIDLAAAELSAAELGRASAAMVDVTDSAALEDLVESTVAEHGSIDLMVNNAGAGIGGFTEELTERHWEKAIDLNLMGVVNGVHAAYPHMLRQGAGTILNTASLAGLMPVPAMLPYTTSKHAVVGLSLGLRAEARSRGIRVSALCPSFVDTPLLDNLYEAPASLGDDPRASIKRIQPKFLTAAQTAGRAMRGLDRNQAIIAVGLVSQLMWRSTRLSPGAMSLAAGIGTFEQRRRQRDAERHAAREAAGDPDSVSVSP